MSCVWSGRKGRIKNNRSGYTKAAGLYMEESMRYSKIIALCSSILILCILLASCSKASSSASVSSLPESQDLSSSSEPEEYDYIDGYFFGSDDGSSEGYSSGFDTGLSTGEQFVVAPFSDYDTNSYDDGYADGYSRYYCEYWLYGFVQGYLSSHDEIDISELTEYLERNS